MDHQPEAQDHQQGPERDEICPHYCFARDVQLKALFKLRQELENTCNDIDAGVPIMVLIIKACSNALKAFPQLNAYRTMDVGRVNQTPDHNIAVAIRTPHGDEMPIIGDVDEMSLVDLAYEYYRMYMTRLENNSYNSTARGLSTFSVINTDQVDYNEMFREEMNNHVAGVSIGNFRRCDYKDVNENDETLIMLRITVVADRRLYTPAVVIAFLEELAIQLEDPYQLCVE